MKIEPNLTEPMPRCSFSFPFVLGKHTWTLKNTGNQQERWKQIKPQIILKQSREQTFWTKIIDCTKQSNIYNLEFLEILLFWTFLIA